MKFSACKADLFLATIFLLLLCTTADKGPLVHTKLGPLRGKYVSVKGKETGVHAYLGVPFAKPPVGPLRLSPPQPAEGWEGERDATQQPPMCAQDRKINVEFIKKISMHIELPDISEDCLYLNIYTPVKPSEKHKLPVMVWIHGGGLTIGSASSYDGSALAAYEDVVVVLIQYRLGILGFMSTEDEHMPGNFGLLDQVEALRWVQQHIHHFGGDPGSVTIFGESAGGVSVSLLLLSPLSAGLFHGAIAESGTAAMDTMFEFNHLKSARIIANLLGCNSSTTEKIADCMKKVPVDDIVKIHKEDGRMLLGPAVDGTFLLKLAAESLKNHEMHRLPVMIGCNTDEAGWLFLHEIAPPGWEDGMDREESITMLTMFLYRDAKDRWKTDLLAEEYMGTSSDRQKIREGFSEVIGDVLFTIPALKTANSHRDVGVPVYLYLFQESPSMLKKKRPSFVGSDHTDELFFVFGSCFTEDQVTPDESCTEEDIQLCKTVMRYWGNFARTRSPNGDGLVQWPQYGAEGDYLAIGMEQVRGQHLKKDRFTFFTQTLPEKIKQHQEKMELLKTKTVHTKLGAVKGEFVSVKGREGVHAFLGVPFAKPPIGPLRLAAPQPTEGWEGVREATKQPPICPQNRDQLAEFIKMISSINVDIPEVSEDCLYLNIYTPANMAQDAKLPVMVWIHGGGFMSGSVSIYDGSALAAYQDMVVVLIQYRLGLLGFLSTGDEHIPGNFGLLDQVEALRWVQQHIHNFGGDPGSVTIFGESAGGVSVSLLLLSPLSDGLFHRAIAESGTAAMDALLTNDPLSFAQLAANASGCDLTSTEKISVCLKHMDHDALMTLVHNQMLHFPVAVDGQFITKPVDELFRNAELLKIPFITGVNNDEGGWLLPSFLAPPNWTEGMDREEVLNTLAVFCPFELMKELAADEYLGTSEDRVKNRDGFTELLGDLVFTIPAIKTANAHRDAGAPVYLYEYQHAPKAMQERRPSFVRSDHGDEIFSVLGFCFTTTHVNLGGLCTKEDKQLSNIMMSYWGNFARTGSPNGDGLVQWPQYGAEGDYLVIGTEQVPGQHLKKDRFTFFTQTLPEKIKQHQGKIDHSEL
uniref:Uncharacterized LOC115361059 n=1 Tax=Myripristis murdjan TaxID=586833 RepID=A0A668AU11_9TELE